jgi:hypothetical protein
MRGPTEHSTLPDTSGPTNEPFVYHLTPAAQQLLAEHEQANGTELHRPAARFAEVTKAAEREARLRRRKARAAGDRGSVGACGQRRPQRNAPLLAPCGCERLRLPHGSRKIGREVGMQQRSLRVNR